MASLLRDARFVVSSWGTTALLEACIFDTPSVQLRWMDALPRSTPEEARLVRDFQRYIHMRTFDATGARPYCDHPSELNGVLAELESHEAAYSHRRQEAVARLTCLPLGEVVDRVVDALAPLLPAARGPGWSEDRHRMMFLGLSVAAYGALIAWLASRLDASTAEWGYALAHLVLAATVNAFLIRFRPGQVTQPPGVRAGRVSRGVSAVLHDQWPQVLLADPVESAA